MSKNNKHYCEGGYAHTLYCKDIPYGMWAQCVRSGLGLPLPKFVRNFNSIDPLNNVCRPLATYCSKEEKIPICFYPKSMGMKHAKKVKECQQICKQKNQSLYAPYGYNEHMTGCGCFVHNFDNPTLTTRGTKAQSRNTIDISDYNVRSSIEEVKKDTIRKQPEFHRRSKEGHKGHKRSSIEEGHKRSSIEEVKKDINEETIGKQPYANSSIGMVKSIR